MKPPQRTPTPGGPLRLIRAAVMPLTFTPRVVRNVSENNLTASSLSAPIADGSPSPRTDATPKRKLAVASDGKPRPKWWAVQDLNL